MSERPTTENAPPGRRGVSGVTTGRREVKTFRRRDGYGRPADERNAQPEEGDQAAEEKRLDAGSRRQAPGQDDQARLPPDHAPTAQGPRLPAWAFPRDSQTGRATMNGREGDSSWS